MIKFVGCILLLTGAVGYAYSLCREKRMQIKQLLQIQYFYRLLQGEILYSGLPLPDILLLVAESVEEPFGSAFSEIGRNVTLQQEESFDSVWKQYLKKALSESRLSRRQKESILRLPESLQLCDRQGQAKALQRQIEEMDKMIRPLEEEARNKNKVIMSLGIAAGVFLTILLL